MLNINNLPSCEGNETISDFCCICNLCLILFFMRLPLLNLSLKTISEANKRRTNDLISTIL